MIDNINIIKTLLNFEKDGDFYFLLVLKRKKDQPEAERDNHQSVRTIKTYCISDIEYLDKRYEEIKMLCEIFKARAYIQIQKQNHYDVSLNMIIDLAQRLKDGVHMQQGLFDSVVGQIKIHEKRWIVDVDTKDEQKLNDIIWAINMCRPTEENKIIQQIPTKNGYHLITKKFDIKRFSETYPEVDVQKKNPTLLFLPNSLS